MSNVILKNITYQYSDKSYALLDFSCEIKKGEFVSVIGKSGCGKTTLLKIIAGLLKPNCGELYINNILVNDMPPQKRDVALMFQEYNLYPNYNVFDNVAFYLKQKKVNIDEVFTKVIDTLRLFGIDDIANRKINELSGGQKQRVALAKLFVRNPDVILFDEPLSNIDESHKKIYHNNILEFKKMLPETTFIYVTHNIWEALTGVDRVLFIDDGREVSISTLDQLVNYPKCIELLEFIKAKEVEQVPVDIKDNTLKLNEFYLDSLNGLSKGNLVNNGINQLLFDDKNQLMGGLTNEFIFNGSLVEDTIIVNNISIPLYEDITKRLLQRNGNIELILKVEKLSKIRLQNSFPLNNQIIKENDKYYLVEVFKKLFMVEKSDLFKHELYYSLDDILINNTNKEKVLANYFIYDNVLSLKKEIITIPLYNCRISNKKVDNSIKLQRVISEEIISDKYKLIYATVKKANTYICFIVEKTCFIDYYKPKFLIYN